MPKVEKFTCDKCDYKSSDTVCDGKFEYTIVVYKDDLSQLRDTIPNIERGLYYLNIERRLGWCFQCKYICPIELLPTIDSIKSTIQNDLFMFEAAETKLIKEKTKIIKFKRTNREILLSSLQTLLVHIELHLSYQEQDIR